jgi:type IV pilus assembly protein PilW
MKLGQRHRMRFTRRTGNRGLTLLELLVSIAIGLAVIAAASYVYLFSRQSARTTDLDAQLNEQGRQALEFVARELQMAWSLPGLRFREGQSNVDSWAAMFYTETALTTPLTGGRMQGLFACNGNNVQIDYGTQATPANCGASTYNGTDSLFVSYFTNDANPDSISGRGTDCLRQRLVPGGVGSGGDAWNTGRNTAVPPVPVQAINVIRVEGTTVQRDDGAARTVGALGCAGNGNLAGNNASFQPIFLGVEQFVIRYGVADFDSDGRIIDTGALSYLTVAQVNALPPLVESLASGSSAIQYTFSPWRRVIAAQVCILMTTQANTAATNTQQAGQFTDCNGAEVVAAGDGSIQRAFRTTVSLRNRSGVAL